VIQSQSDSGIDSYRDRVSKFSSELDLGLVFYILKKSLWVVAVFFIICFSVAFVYLRYSQPIYQSSTVIQINDNNEASKVLQIGTTENTTNKIAEAIEQIRSKIFLKRVVEKSDVQVSYFNEGTFKSNELYKSSPYFIKFNIKKNSIYGVKIYITFNNLNSGILNFNAEGRTHNIPFSTNNVVNSKYFDLSISLNTQFEKKQIQNTLSENNKAYFIINNVDDVTAELQSKLEIKLLNEAAKTILITVKDVNANKAKDLVNIVSEEYLTFDVERKSESSKSIITFIDDQLKNVYESLKESENNLQDFRKGKNYTDKDVVLSANMMRINSLEDEMLEVEMEEKILAELQANIAKNKSIDTYQLISLIAGTEYESSIREYTQGIQKLLLEKENLLYQVTPQSENIKQINYNIETQKKLLIESLNAIRLKYKSKYTNLMAKSSEFKSKYERAPDEDMEHARLMRLFSISEKYYTMLLERKTEFSI
jgi:tyrosine-protein kinase Etk/Wzc